MVGVAFVFIAARRCAAQMPNPYGPSITLENAKKAAMPALAEAAKNNWSMAVAIVDPGGDLVYYEKMDNTQLGSANVAIDKARSAALFKRPTKAFQDALAAGGEGLRVLGLQGATPVEGGIPLVSDGKIVGAIGVSGGTSAQDGQCARRAPMHSRTDLAAASHLRKLPQRRARHLARRARCPPDSRRDGGATIATLGNHTSGLAI
jgi:glc operon protein GlcG